MFQCLISFLPICSLPFMSFSQWLKAQIFFFLQIKRSARNHNNFLMCFTFYINQFQAIFIKKKIFVAPCFWTTKIMV